MFILKKIWSSKVGCPILLIFIGVIIGLVVGFLWSYSKTITEQKKVISSEQTIKSLHSQLETVNKQLSVYKDNREFSYHSETKADGTIIVDIKRKTTTEQNAQAESSTRRITDIDISMIKHLAVDEYKKTEINKKVFGFGPAFTAGKDNFSFGPAIKSTVYGPITATAAILYNKKQSSMIGSVTLLYEK